MMQMGDSRSTYITQLQTHVGAKVASLDVHLVGAHLQKVELTIPRDLHTRMS